MDSAGQGLYPKSSQYLSAVALNLSIALALSKIAEDQEGRMAELWDESVYRSDSDSAGPSYQRQSSL